MHSTDWSIGPRIPSSVDNAQTPSTLNVVSVHAKEDPRRPVCENRRSNSKFTSVSAVQLLAVRIDRTPERAQIESSEMERRSPDPAFRFEARSEETTVGSYPTPNKRTVLWNCFEGRSVTDKATEPRTPDSMNFERATSRFLASCLIVREKQDPCSLCPSVSTPTMRIR